MIYYLVGRERRIFFFVNKDIFKEGKRISIGGLGKFLHLVKSEWMSKES